MKPNESRAGQIAAHYTKCWGLPGARVPFSAGPVDQLPTDFSVLEFPPHGQRTAWTYATCGMSLDRDPKPVELHLFSPLKTIEMVELLYVVAHYHRTGALLDLGHTVNFGKPWLGQSLCGHGLISPPYLDGPELEKLKLASGDGYTSVYWLIPITAQEVAYKKKNGLEALEQKFENAAFDYLNPKRPSVV